MVNSFFGCFGYADDLVVLSASRSGLQSMINLYSDFALSKNLKISANMDPVNSKTKCIIFTKKRKKFEDIPPVILNGDPLPWVSELKHLGNILEVDNSMKKDCSTKRAKFVGKLNSLQQEFHFVKPDILVKILNIYAVSFYGSGLWNIFSADCDRFYKAWNVCIRIFFNLDRGTHHYLIEPLSNSLHPQVMLASRFVKFLRTLRTCDKFGIRLLASVCAMDQRTVFGRTISQISEKCNCTLKNLTTCGVKKVMRYYENTEEESWRTGIAREIIDDNLGVPGFTDKELEEILHYICVS